MSSLMMALGACGADDASEANPAWVDLSGPELPCEAAETSDGLASCIEGLDLEHRPLAVSGPDGECYLVSDEPTGGPVSLEPLDRCRCGTSVEPGHLEPQRVERGDMVFEVFEDGRLLAGPDNTRAERTMEPSGGGEGLVITVDEPEGVPASTSDGWFEKHTGLALVLAQCGLPLEEAVVIGERFSTYDGRYP